MSGGVKLAAFAPNPHDPKDDENICFVDMVATVEEGGVCPEACAMCGAFTSADKGPQVPLSTEAFEAMLTRRIESIVEGVEDRIAADYLAPDITSGVTNDPTRNPNYPWFAKRVFELTKGRSRFVTPSHGARCVVVPERRDHLHLTQLDSLFDMENGHSYNPEQWKSFLERIEECRLPEELKDKIYEAFVRKLRLLHKVSEMEGGGDAVFLRRLDEMGLSGGVYRRLFDLAETSEVSGNKLMLEHMEVISGLHRGGVLKEKLTDTTRESQRILGEIVELVCSGVISGFVLTVDLQRSDRKIPLATNMFSYLKTLEILRPALAPNSKGFVAISVQGLSSEKVPRDHPSCIDRARVFWQKLLKMSDLTPEEKANLQNDRGNSGAGRDYVLAGRAREDSELAPFLSADDRCEVIPFQQFVDDRVNQWRKMYRASIDATGAISFQHVEPGATYNSTVREGAWSQFVDAGAIRESVRGGASRVLADEIGRTGNLTERGRVRTRQIRWESNLAADGDIFLIKPFSLLRRGDRGKAMALINGLFGGSLTGAVIEDRGGRRGLRFADLKLQTLKRLKGDEELGTLITQASPYEGVIRDLSMTGQKIGVTLGRESYYSGEMRALAIALEEKLEIDYLLRELDASLEATEGDSEQPGGEKAKRKSGVRAQALRRLGRGLLKGKREGGSSRALDVKAAGEEGEVVAEGKK